jgi:NAD(P)-dependent dehydrogenase (short-subunit alcohol dehydrogenase family)
VLALAGAARKRRKTINAIGLISSDCNRPGPAVIFGPSERMIRHMQSMYREDLLKGKRILVTGGGTGLGRVMASHYAQHGAMVYICGRRGQLLQTAAAQMSAQYRADVRAIVCDIKDPGLVDRMIEEIFADGALDGLVNNAAGQFLSPTKDLSPRGFEAITDIVFKGTFFVTLAVGKRWIASKRRGSIISIITTWVRTGSAFTVPSAMAKAGVDVMTKSLAVEWGPYGIRVNAIAPGPFPTEGAWARLRPGEPPDSRRPYRSVPLGRAGEMHELANLATFLIADGCEYLTGETIAIDGAQHLTSSGTFGAYSECTDEEWRQMREAIKSANAKDKAQRSVDKP